MSSNEAGRIVLITGLGNPGKEYEGTRHNAGFSAVEKLLEVLPGSFKKEEAFSSVYWKGRLGDRNIFIQKPMTFMNLSGKAVSPLMAYYKIKPSELLLVYDDLDLPLGRIRIRKDGSSGGHNGVKSVEAETASRDFARLRIGIGRADSPKQVDYVLSGFGGDEKKLFNLVLGKALEAMNLALRRGIDTAMNEMNGTVITLNEGAAVNENKPKIMEE